FDSIIIIHPELIFAYLCVAERDLLIEHN
ncbi:MAG: hypothetical protein ACI90V_006242, partial [Bacillariaceae sp.]